MRRQKQVEEMNLEDLLVILSKYNKEGMGKCAVWSEIQTKGNKLFGGVRH